MITSTPRILYVHSSIIQGTHHTLVTFPVDCLRQGHDKAHAVSCSSTEREPGVLLSAHACIAAASIQTGCDWMNNTPSLRTAVAAAAAVAPAAAAAAAAVGTAAAVAIIASRWCVYVCVVGREDLWTDPTKPSGSQAICTPAAAVPAAAAAGTAAGTAGRLALWVGSPSTLSIDGSKAVFARSKNITK